MSYLDRWIENSMSVYTCSETSRWAETIDKVQVFVDWMNGRLTTLQTENEW